MTQKVSFSLIILSLRFMVQEAFSGQYLSRKRTHFYMSTSLTARLSSMPVLQSICCIQQLFSPTVLQGGPPLIQHHCYGLGSGKLILPVWKKPHRNEVLLAGFMDLWSTFWRAENNPKILQKQKLPQWSHHGTWCSEIGFCWHSHDNTHRVLIL